jgi:hypothetical protein
MPQFDFGNLESPLSGASFINDNLEPWRDALHSLHSGTTRPTYAVAGMMWLDITTVPWELKVFDGSDDISLGSINSSTNVFTPNLPTGSVGSTQLATGSVVTNAVGANQITYAKIQTVAANKLLGAITSGNVTEIDLTAAGRNLIDDASTSAQRTTLGLGAAALIDPNPFRGVLGTNQTGILPATWTKIVFDSETYDVGSYFNTANGRFTPLVAGYYSLVGVVEFNTTNIADGSAARAAIYYNGGTQIDYGPYNNASTAAVNIGAIAAGQRFFNGSTDYAEVYALGGGAGNKTANSSATFFYGVRVG